MKIKKRKKLLLLTLALLIILLALGSGYVYWNLSKITNVDFNYSDSEIGIISSALPVDKTKITNILLLGVDKQEIVTDTMIILSIDEINRKLKMTSLLRDTYIYFGEGAGNKLNYAYHYGGAKLSIKTINENFNLDIRDYVLVNFDGLSNIIDKLGGVEIDVQPEEVNLIDVSYPGKQILNGAQALTYCRIREVGNGDSQRTERQRAVLTQLLYKMKDTSIFQLPQYIDALAGYVETSISKTEMITLSNKALIYSKNGVEENKVPYDQYRYHSAEPSGWYVMKWDKAENIRLLHEFIYGK